MHNIILVGVLDKKSSTNISMALSFKNFGINVIPINYRTLIATKGSAVFERILIDSIKQYKPILVIFSKCNGIRTEIVKVCSSLTKTWLWFMDAYPILDMHPEIIEHAKACTFSSCTSISSANYMESKGVKNVHHIFEGMDSTIHKPVTLEEKYKAEISFIGSKTDFRQKLYDVLLENNIDAKFYGPGFNSFVEPEEWAKIYSSSKFALSVGSFNDIEDYFPGRVFETLGCGVATIHYDTTDTIKKHFRVNTEILVFETESELVDLIKNTSNQKACSLAINGREKCFRCYTWDHSIYDIIGIYNETSNSN